MTFWIVMLSSASRIFLPIPSLALQAPSSRRHAAPPRSVPRWRRCDRLKIDRVRPVCQRVSGACGAQARAAAPFSIDRMTSWVEAPGRKTSATPRLFSSGMSWAGMIPPTKTRDVVHAPLAQQLQHAPADGQVGAGEDAEADDVGVLLGGGRDDLLRALPQAGVDDLHARVAQRAGDHLGAAVVAVESRLGDAATRSASDGRARSCRANRMSRQRLEDRRLLVLAEDLAQRVAHLAERGVGARRPRGSGASGCRCRAPRPSAPRGRARPRAASRRCPQRLAPAPPARRATVSSM